MVSNNLWQFIIFKLSAICMIAFCVGLIYLCTVFMDVEDTYSLISLGDIIQYNGKTIICIGGVPLLIWVFFFSLKTLLHKGIKPLKKATVIGNIWLGISIASCCLGFVMSFIIPFIFMFSSYTSCNTDTYSNYYVIHPDLCKAIVTHRLGNK
ncbi:DUF1240 domain-containing protein [Rahnella laticis]|uniref:DUF1240 domain-containing protein n=2 Tax=Yersiniaceae TaxID=1903411 RepID=A0ABS0E224_9GAMM|nr:DUF1240 domain-containing protein [Rahnella laticis]MBF7998966.1 DUF1240 domain-containing protein [Rahnella sp. LAC-M12]